MNLVYNNIMKKFLIVCCLLISSMSFSQDSPEIRNTNKVIRKINIKHIDPMLLSLILQGKVSFVSPSEISSLIKGTGN